MEISEKTWKKKKKRWLKEKQNKKKNSDLTPATRVNTTYFNTTRGVKKEL